MEMIPISMEKNSKQYLPVPPDSYSGLHQPQIRRRDTEHCVWRRFFSGMKDFENASEKLILNKSSGFMLQTYTFILPR